jgi:hypothetical protein
MRYSATVKTKQFTAFSPKTIGKPWLTAKALRRRWWRLG